jgi:hypothetical protein
MFNPSFKLSVRKIAVTIFLASQLGLSDPATAGGNEPLKNQRDWVLDVPLDEGRCCVRQRHAAPTSPAYTVLL